MSNIMPVCLSVCIVLPLSSPSSDEDSSVMKVTSFLKRQTVVEGYKQVVVVVVVFRLSRETQQSFCSITSEPRLHRTTQVRTGSVCSHLHRRLHRPANQTRVNQTLC